MTLTLERMRADIAELVELDPAEIGDDDMLSDLGLDSLRLMRLTLTWAEAEPGIDLSALAEYSTLGEWWREVVRPALPA